MFSSNQSLVWANVSKKSGSSSFFSLLFLVVWSKIFFVGSGYLSSSDIIQWSSQLLMDSPKASFHAPKDLHCHWISPWRPCTPDEIPSHCWKSTLDNMQEVIAWKTLKTAFCMLRYWIVATNFRGKLSLRRVESKTFLKENNFCKGDF